MNREKQKWVLQMSALVALLVLLAAYCLVPTPYAVQAAKVPPYAPNVVTDTPTITIAGATATTTATPTTASREAHIVWTFGTVAGSYTSCTVQAQTTYDGTNFLTMGSAQSVTVTSTTVNAWDIYQQAPAATGVTN